MSGTQEWRPCYICGEKVLWQTTEAEQRSVEEGIRRQLRLCREIAAMARVCEAARNVSEVERRYLRAPSDMSASAIGGSVAKMRIALADLERSRKGTT